ncbi:hypothetical protein DINM_006445 [Dirofilaria immitis]|nr:hypothetical protein [Dirofilaria immitis]
MNAEAFKPVSISIAPDGNLQLIEAGRFGQPISIINIGDYPEFSCKVLTGAMEIETGLNASAFISKTSLNGSIDIDNRILVVATRSLKICGISSNTLWCACNISSNYPLVCSCFSQTVIDMFGFVSSKTAVE